CSWNYSRWHPVVSNTGGKPLKRNTLLKSNKMQIAATKTGQEQERGFSLIELSIVVLISGLMIAQLVQLYVNYLQAEKIETTKENIVDAARAIALSSTIRYPCPSDRSLPTTDPNYGADVCAVAGFTLAGIPTCTAGLEQGICKATGARDTDDDADATVGNGNEVVLIGGVPLTVGGTAIGGISTSTIADAWGQQLTYAVSYTSARPNRSEGFTRFKNGVIAVHDEFGNDTAGTNSDAQFVVFSHGPDRRGGWGSLGGGRLNCIVGNADGENCDGDSTFAQGLAHYEGTTHYDDYAYVQTDESANLWLVVPDGTAANLPTSHIKTIPNGAVGIDIAGTPGNASPAGTAVRLDVNGDIRANTVRTVDLCKKDGTKCMSMDWNNNFFGSKKTAGAVKNTCGTGEVISSISNSQVQCSKANVTTTGTAILCPVGEWVQQIYTDGKVKCTNGVTCPGGAGCL
ncbi:MAG TPA: type II secretion system protein, partial [Alphaproteobacteria bacterium]|nr:type II secretion system protein [Alphaproteobacteria bacterium]